MVEKRGMNYDESMKYVGVKRRTFDEKWRSPNRDAGGYLSNLRQIRSGQTLR